MANRNLIQIRYNLGSIKINITNDIKTIKDIKQFLNVNHKIPIENMIITKDQNNLDIINDENMTLNDCNIKSGMTLYLSGRYEKKRIETSYVSAGVVTNAGEYIIKCPENNDIGDGLIVGNKNIETVTPTNNTTENTSTAIKDTVKENKISSSPIVVNNDDISNTSNDNGLPVNNNDGFEHYDPKLYESMDYTDLSPLPKLTRTPSSNVRPPDSVKKMTLLNNDDDDEFDRVIGNRARDMFYNNSYYNEDRDDDGDINLNFDEFDADTINELREAGLTEKEILEALSMDKKGNKGRRNNVSTNNVYSQNIRMQTNAIYNMNNRITSTYQTTKYADTLGGGYTTETTNSYNFRTSPLITDFDDNFTTSDKKFDKVDNHDDKMEVDDVDEQLALLAAYELQKNDRSTAVSAHNSNNSNFVDITNDDSIHKDDDDVKMDEADYDDPLVLAGVYGLHVDEIKQQKMLLDNYEKRKTNNNSTSNISKDKNTIRPQPDIDEHEQILDRHRDRIINSLNNNSKHSSAASTRVIQYSDLSDRAKAISAKMDKLNERKVEGAVSKNVSSGKTPEIIKSLGMNTSDINEQRELFSRFEQMNNTKVPYTNASRGDLKKDTDIRRTSKKDLCDMLVDEYSNDRIEKSRNDKNAKVKRASNMDVRTSIDDTDLSSNPSQIRLDNRRASDRSSSKLPNSAGSIIENESIDATSRQHNLDKRRNRLGVPTDAYEPSIGKIPPKRNLAANSTHVVASAPMDTDLSITGKSSISSRKQEKPSLSSNLPSEKKEDVPIWIKNSMVSDSSRHSSKADVTRNRSTDVYSTSLQADLAESPPLQIMGNKGNSEKRHSKPNPKR